MDEERQLSFLAPDQVEREVARRNLLQIIEENLALVRELAALYNLPHMREKRRQIRSPHDVAELLALEMSLLEQEQLRVVVLDTRNEVMTIEMVYQGNLNTTLVRIGELFKEAVRRNAAAVILAHNHPSGSPSPSPEDLEVTRQAVKAGKLLNIDVLDHLIIGREGEYLSLKERCPEVWKQGGGMGLLRESSETHFHLPGQDRLALRRRKRLHRKLQAFRDARGPEIGRGLHFEPTRPSERRD